MRQSLVTRLALHAANLLVIAFLLLPLAAATIGALQSAKSLQASTRTVLPPEWTLDNFRVILSGGAQKGAIFEQATYLPDNVKKIHYTLANSGLDCNHRHPADAGVRFAIGLHRDAPAAALGDVADEPQRVRSLRAHHSGDDPALRHFSAARSAQLGLGRHHRPDRLSAALWRGDPGPISPPYHASSRRPRASTAARALAPFC